MSGLQRPGPSSSDLARIGIALALFGIAATLLTFAIAMDETWSPGVFWPVVATGLAIAVPGAWLVLPRARRRHRLLVAAEECWEFHHSVDDFLHEQLRNAPSDTPTGLRGRQASRMREWESETVARYRNSFREWGLEAFDQAVDLHAVAASSRATVEGDSVDQIKLLPGLFRRAAKRLERLADGDY